MTLPGLGLKVGGPAINATPRKMIRQELIPLLPSPDSVAIVTVSVPGGEELAKRTFNPKLGIIGGISIIGTSGIGASFLIGRFYRLDTERSQCRQSDRLRDVGY